MFFSVQVMAAFGNHNMCPNFRHALEDNAHAIGSGFDAGWSGVSSNGFLVGEWSLLL